MSELQSTEPVTPPSNAPEPTPAQQPVNVEPKVLSTMPTPSPITPAPKHEDKHSNLRSTLTSIFILLMAPAIALVLTLYVFQSYQVDGQSMETTLQNNDRLIVWKAARTMAQITNKQYIPNRGDVIIFNEPGLGGLEDNNGNKQLVKRVIGLPGDKVVVKDGTITVYNDEHPDGFKPDSTLAYGNNNHIPETDGEMSYTLAANQLFVCGDNRPNSLDSRVFGPITTDQVVGKLIVRILPLSKAQIF